MKLLIDGDILAFACASVGDGHVWKSSDGHRERYKKDILTHCESKNLSVLDLKEEYIPEPIENVLHSLKLMLESVFDSFECVNSYQIYLTGKNNYRNDVGTILKYKGNRDGTRRPHWLPKCRDYLVEQWGARVEEGQEADDALGIAQYGEAVNHLGEFIDGPDQLDTCICSIDKDLLAIPGNHYNWNSDKHVVVTPIEGMRNFYKQLVTGDSTDNILGLYGVGPKAKMLKEINKCFTELDMLDIVWEQYHKRFGNYTEQFLVENARLLWIRRQEDEIWELPHNRLDKENS